MLFRTALYITAQSAILLRLWCVLSYSEYYLATPQFRSLSLYSMLSYPIRRVSGQSARAVCSKPVPYILLLLLKFSDMILHMKFSDETPENIVIRHSEI